MKFPFAAIFLIFLCSVVSAAPTEKPIVVKGPTVLAFFRRQVSDWLIRLLHVLLGTHRPANH
jgi:hypothetical protein